MRELLPTIDAWTAEGLEVSRAAVIRTFGSSPRREGATMLRGSDGRISSRVLRRALFSAAREVAGVDDEVSPEEGSILEAIAVRFG